MTETNVYDGPVFVGKEACTLCGAIHPPGDPCVRSGILQVREDMIKRIIKEVRPYSMVPDAGLATTIRLTLATIDKNIPGDLVECGTWRGGASFAMLLAQRHAYGEIRRPVHMFDSFKGMSMPAPQDGEHAQWWYKRSITVPVDPDNVDYCISPLETVLDGLKHFSFEGRDAYVYPGWLHETVPRNKPKQIAVLRVDCDWYEPCKVVYRELAPLVAQGGAVIIDDYMAWEGCVLATHEYLVENKLPWMIQSAEGLCGAFMIKSPATW